jgi:hypothetical protein
MLCFFLKPVFYVQISSLYWTTDLLLFLAALLSMLSNLGSDFQSEIIPTTIYVLISLVVQIIDNNLSQPIIFFKSVSSHPLEIFPVIL